MKTLDIPLLRTNRTIAQLLIEQAGLRGDRPFGIFPDTVLTFGDVHTGAIAWAKAFRAAGVLPGDHVATLMPNCADWVPIYFGALYAGAVIVPLNARYKRQELAYTLAHCRARVLVTTSDFAAYVDYEALLRDVLQGFDDAHRFPLSLPEQPELRAVVMCGEGKTDPFLSEADFLALGADIPTADLDAAQATRTITDPAAIIYTSGTTSNPKGCLLSHEGIQNCWSTFAAVVKLQPGESVWMPMPFFHTGGIGPMTTILAHGAAFATQPHFEAPGMVDMIQRHRIQHLYPGFPQLSFPVLEHPDYDREMFSYIRSLLNVGPPAMQQRLQDLLPEGATLLNLFGMTEGSGIVTFTPVDAPLDKRINTSGHCPPHSEVRIADPDTLLPCPDGMPGEIQFRGGGALLGYFQDPKATAETIIDGGWVRTGDRGKIDPDGYLVYLGRIKDMLKVGGENVAAAEIEAFLQTVPGIRLAQVISMPDDRLGEVPVAFVEKREDSILEEASVISACDGQLARWKIPRRVVFVTDWPMSATKVQKFRLRELL